MAVDESMHMQIFHQSHALRMLSSLRPTPIKSYSNCLSFSKFKWNFVCTEIWRQSHSSMPQLSSLSFNFIWAIDSSSELSTKTVNECSCHDFKWDVIVMLLLCMFNIINFILIIWIASLMRHQCLLRHSTWYVHRLVHCYRI